jgi:CheY-like chemotaxis protein
MNPHESRYVPLIILTRENPMSYIMVVDDDREILHILTQLLESEGYTVRAFDDSWRALERARIAPPALALVDILMPRMNGRELVQRLRAEVGNALPIIAMSASARREQVSDLTVQDFVDKPFDLDDVVDRVGRFAHTARDAWYAPHGESQSAACLPPRRHDP